MYAKDGAAVCRRCTDPTQCINCRQPALFPENDAAVEAYFIAMRQWRLGPTGRRIGIDYTGLEAGLRLAGITLTPADFDRLRDLEHETLKMIDEASK